MANCCCFWLTFCPRNHKQQIYWWRNYVQEKSGVIWQQLVLRGPMVPRDGYCFLLCVALNHLLVNSINFFQMEVSFINLYFAKSTRCSFPKVKWHLPVSSVLNPLHIISDSSEVTSNVQHGALQFPVLEMEMSGRRPKLPWNSPAVSWNLVVPWVLFCSLQSLFHTLNSEDWITCSSEQT